MNQVFISYTTADKEITTDIRNYLEANGIRCWMGNRDIPGGTNYTNAITQAIKESNVFVLILSKKSQKSKYVFRELEYAVKMDVPVIPYLIEDQILSDSFHFLLSATNGIHAFEHPLNGKKQLLQKVKSISDLKSEFDVDKSQFYPETPTVARNVECPVCKSKKNKYTDILSNLKKLSEFYTRYTDKIVFILVTISLMISSVYFLCVIPTLRQKILTIITCIPYLGDKVITAQNPHEEIGKLACIFFIFGIIISEVKYYFSKLKRTYSRYCIHNKRYTIQYICEDCETEFTKEFELEEIDILTHEEKPRKMGEIQGLIIFISTIIPLMLLIIISTVATTLISAYKIITLKDYNKGIEETTYLVAKILESKL